MSQNTRKTILYISLFILAVITVLLFSGTTSPLYPNSYGVDSAFNRFMGLMIQRGKVLYSDIWDNKAPVLFLIQAVGVLKGTHNAEITITFLLQILTLFLSILFLVKADAAANPSRRNYLPVFFLIFCGLTVFSKVIEGGNLSEEWSMPMICCSLYLLVKYAFNVEGHPDHPKKFAFIHGICFGLLAFIRVNNAISMCAGLVVVAIYLIKRNKWKNLFENIIFGIIGTAVIAIPIIIYFLSKHALADMIYAVFTHNLKYAAQRTHKSFSGVDLYIRFAPMAASALSILISMLRSKRVRFAEIMMLIITAANSVMLWRTNIFLHYYTIFVPVLILIMLLYADISKIPDAVLVLALCGLFIWQDSQLLSGLPNVKNEPDKYAYAASIPEEEKDSCIAIWVSPEVYLNSGLIPVSRYAAYQFTHFPVNPSMHDEFITDILTQQPRWIIILSGYEEIYPEVGEMLMSSYQKQWDEYGVSYYHLSEP